MFKRRPRGPWPPAPEDKLFTRRLPIIYTVTEVVPGGCIRAGMTGYAEGTGWWLGTDEDGEAKFSIGTPSDYLKYSETGGIQIAADGSGLTSIDGGNIITESILVGSLAVGTLTFDRMVSGALSENLIVNPSFEDGSAPHDLATDSDGTWSVQTTIKRGAYALQYNPAGQTDHAFCYLNGNPTSEGALYRHASTLEGKKYTFTFQGYRAAGTTANAVRGYVRFYTSARVLINAYYSGFDPSTWTDDTWTECTTSKTAPAGAAYVVFALCVRNDAEAGSLYFDDLNARTMIGSGLIDVDAVLAEHINVTNLQAVSTQTGALTVDDKLTMGTDGVIEWMSGAAEISEDSMDVALTNSDRYAFRFVDGAAVHAYFAAQKSANLTQVSIEAVGPASTKYGKLAFAAIEYIAGAGDPDPETVDCIMRSDTGVIFDALNFAAARIFKVATMNAWFTNKLGVGKTPTNRLDLDFATEDVGLVNAGSAAATEQDWIEVTVGGNTGYIRVHAAK